MEDPEYSSYGGSMADLPGQRLSNFNSRFANMVRPRHVRKREVLMIF
ncbi:hypothetical protein FOXG_21363 [Fusarium oxysporum f. sp. lycopersici 4287]|uniref:Uncharacterized protein n=1 Tax=Fusarium oxysporum f. sp. lycopersici (strain 4287 / CBS 123668 / FGSC 9935 / NRRL 34936) TaxID=426428 RepID=A0A0J9VXM5_FUSO4|nr:hypothetical protein FOXG_20944 [Fusarium oxysporum f. sp. lycopersici 4287]XP_018253566.1 hypothetical protein FOXG_21363 [Fusarium oxysporum f. sp. lycopersici 4287]EWZ78193.1 hypothetical protein FOWG_17495 [Fusarium oxysporum f. sp. lycopersici MN25]KNB13839.1 hypothetical protein FOXG_20944 [Fusarium oxysporum f. sp. lycopersici 4287]KNB15521.1 hypothetical protein FOXG_21363 [Fusarium oxysporum f. sp. lycopersici 4287]